MRSLTVTATAALLGATLVAGQATPPSPTYLADQNYWAPDENAPHRRTWMAYGGSEAIHGNSAEGVKDNLALLADTIGAYEPVVLLANASDVADARSRVTSPNVTVISAAIDDLWMRDTGPVFAYACSGYASLEACRTAGPTNARALNAVNFNFNGWGEKQFFANDATVAVTVAAAAGNVPVRISELIMEGGGIELDGEGTALATESCILNANRNDPNTITKAVVEEELRALLGVEKVIWTTGIAGRDITDGHIDFYARFAHPGVVVVARENDPSLYDYNVTRRVIADVTGATDARGRTLEVNIIDNPNSIRPGFATGSFAASYINYYVANGVVVAPQFGDAESDTAARNTLAALYPTRTVEMINIDSIAEGGGGIHCATMQEPIGTAPRPASIDATPSPPPAGPSTPSAASALSGAMSAMTAAVALVIMTVL